MSDGQAPQGFWRKNRLKVVLSLGLGAAFAYVLSRGGLPIVPSAAVLSQVSVPACGLYLLLMITMHAFRATRWRFLLAPIAHVPLRRVVTVSFIGFAAILLFPLRAGEVVRPYMIQQKGRVTLAAATGTIGAERVIDGLYLTLLLGICLQISHPLSPLPDHIADLKIPVAAVPFYAYVSLAAFLAAFALMGLFYLRPVLGHRLAEVTIGLFSPRLAEKAADFVARLADGLKFLPSFRYFGLFLLETTLYWGVNALGMFVLARGCGIASITFVQACVTMGVLGVGILVPAGPGLFGAFQASLFAAFAMYFPTEVVVGPGAAFVFLIYVFQFTWHMITGAVSLLIARTDDDTDGSAQAVAADVA